MMLRLIMALLRLIPTPKLGEDWEFIEEKNKSHTIWPKNRMYPPVKILDVKGGWVRYSIGELFPDERLTIRIFTALYRRKHAAKPGTNSLQPDSSALSERL